MIHTFIKSASPLVSKFISSSKLYLSVHIRASHNLSNKFKDLYMQNTKYRTLHSNDMAESNAVNPDNEIISDSNNLVFVQSNSKEDSIIISFNLTYDGKSKQFNMIRKTSEPLSSTLERIKLNLVKLTKPKKGKKNLKVEEKPDNFDDITLLLNNSPVELDIKNIDAWVDGASIKLNDKLYRIVTNAPQVESIKLPNCIMNNFVMMPTINLINCDTAHSKFKWYRQISSLEKEKYMKEGIYSDTDITFDNRNYWYKMSEGLLFCPKLEDVGHYVKVVCIPSDGLRDGPQIDTISPKPIQLGPSCCPFEKRHEFTKERIKDPKKFRFMTYNLLADLYADSDYSRTVLFDHCPAHALDIDYRRQLLLKEILGYNADIYCLQEVDRKEFERTYQPCFRSIGDYTGIFDSKGGQVAEGEATFFHNDKFILVDTHKVLLSSLIDTEDLILCKKDFFRTINSSKAQRCLDELNEICKAIKAKPELNKRFRDRHTILQLSLLKFKETDSKELGNNFLLVANTHLYFAPDADHIRLLQGSLCVKYLELMKEYYTSHLDDAKLSCLVSPLRIYTIFTGDMNSTPDCGLYQLLTKGKADSNLPDWSSAGEKESVQNLEVTTNLRFSTAYQNIQYTNYTPGFNGCLDYIYYELDFLICDSTVPLPAHKDVTAVGGLPSDVFPSDHLALIANFKISA